MSVLTLLATGSKYSLVGDATGQITRMLNTAVKLIKPSIEEAERVPCPPLTDNRVAGYIPIVRRDIPPEVVLRFQYHICPVSLIRIYYVFEVGRAKWYVRELRGKDGKGTGHYHTEGGGYEPPALSIG